MAFDYDEWREIVRWILFFFFDFLFLQMQIQKERGGGIFANTKMEPRNKKLTI